ncbi:CPBP family intramembrane glutamic endopeptidase [Anaerobium acetethylicum]|uniref:CAAX prenyl protease 2/Lysostaphin resistance protein A-like domain-containing protein n=1 Tax=Anaerobium acetethylicum TaxID=1619234 RepID=A0A1D3TPZ0_9FIRM|nr:type II CAAX endopeptidase family protein [Anaerobium acetethylicum]SCP95605.1 hypothetical protein SAMN05421730_100257 [Anaerobium acetethylicum]
MKKTADYFKCILPLICALGIQIAVATAGMIAYFAVNVLIMTGQGKTMDEIVEKTLYLSPDINLLVSMLASIACLAVFYFWYRRLSGDTGSMKIRGMFPVKTAGTIVILGVALQASVAWILTMISNAVPNLFDGYNELMESITGGNMLLMLIFTGIVAPFSEELIFRGVLLKKASKIMPLAAANVFQAVMFGIYHMNWIQGIYAFVLGMFLGMVFIKYGSIYHAILLHMVFNISNAVLNGFLTKMPDMAAMIVSTILFAVSAVVIAFVSRNMLKTVVIEKDFEKCEEQCYDKGEK